MSKIKKQKDIVKLRNNFLKVKLRRLSLYWPERTAAYHAAKVERGVYKCQECNKKTNYKDLEIDHVEPVVPLTGMVYQDNGEIDWNFYIPRLFCDASNLCALCKKSHELKTAQEQEMRTYYRDKERNANKSKLRKKNE